MGTAVFPYVLQRAGAREFLEFKTAIHEQGGGRRIAQKIRASGEFVARGRLLFPNPGGTYAAFDTFWKTHFGAFESFLYAAGSAHLRFQGDSFVATTGQTDFDAARRFVKTAGLVVKKNGVVQTLTTHYTLENESGGAYVLGTSTKLVVAFVNAPGNGVTVTLDYDFYYPVRFESDDQGDSQDLIGGGVGPATVADRGIAIAMRETGPGFSYAGVPNAL